MASDFAHQLARARQGDRAALDELFTPWRALLRLQARRLLGSGLSSRVDASDVVQETLTQAFTDLADFRGSTEGEWVAWLRRLVAGHTAKTVRFHLAGKRDASREKALAETQDVSDPVSPDDPLMDRERAARLAAAIEGLPRDMRDVVLRRVFDQEPFIGIARSLGCSCGAARVLWTRALQRLRQAIPE